MGCWWHVFKEEGQSVVYSLAFDHVVVVENQGEGLVLLAEVVDEEGENRFDGGWLGGLEC